MFPTSDLTLQIQFTSILRKYLHTYLVRNLITGISNTPINKFPTSESTSVRRKHLHTYAHNCTAEETCKNIGPKKIRS